MIDDPPEKTCQPGKKVEAGVEIHVQPLPVIEHRHSDTEAAQKFSDFADRERRMTNIDIDWRLNLSVL